jgi:thioredoxin reductase (NADPH)
MLIPVAIIGAGPAGIAAAIELKRSGIEFLLLESNRIGGLLHEANLVENFPGIAHGVPGRTLAARLQRQLAFAGIKTQKSNVLQLGYHGGCFLIRAGKQTIKAAKVILACGTLPLPPGAPLDHLLSRGLVFNSLLPLLRSNQKTIAVIGGGDAACDYALNLARKNNVHILIRSDKPCALPLLLDRCRSHPRIMIHENSPLADARPGEGAEGIILKIKDARSGRAREIVCHLVLTAVGRTPALHFLEPDLRAAGPRLQMQKKLFIAGDAGNGRFRQAAIASADGLRAAMEINADK